MFSIHIRREEIQNMRFFFLSVYNMNDLLVNRNINSIYDRNILDKSSKLPKSGLGVIWFDTKYFSILRELYKYSFSVE